MLKLTVRLQSAAAPPGSFPAQPKTLYRAGSRYCRIEEMPDTENNIQGLLITSAPDTWMVDLIAKTARHTLEQASPSACKLQIFGLAVDTKPGDAEKDPLNKLEFGRELAFFKENGATGEKGPTFQGHDTTGYRLNIDQSKLVLFTSGSPEKPVGLVMARDSQPEMFLYDKYEELKFDPKLFEKPADVKIVETGGSKPGK